VKIGIVGAGATGLTAGYELAKRGHQVCLFERDDRIGGLARTHRVGDRQLEVFYHHIFTSDTDFIDLAGELGLASRLLWLHPRNAIYADNRLFPFTSPKDLLFFKPLSLIDRVRLGLLTIKARKIRDWPVLENITVRQWVVQTAGEKVWEKFWRPLLVAKFDLDADRIAATWLWNKIKLRGSTRGKNPSREVLGYMDGSFGLVYDRLAEKIKELGGRIRLSSEVKEMTPLPDSTLKIGEEIFDAVIATAAPSTLPKIVPAFSPGYREQLNQVKYKANLCLLLELAEPLSPYYWTSVAQDDFPFVAVIEHTNLLPVEGYNSHVVYLSRYIDERNELYLESDEKIRDIFLYSLKRMFPQFNPAGIIHSQVHRARFAQPVIVTGYSKIRPEFETPVKNLYLASMAQIFPEDRGQNYAIRMGKQIAGLIHDRK
jgi:protoporphyrinogen oxidase